MTRTLLKQALCVAELGSSIQLVDIFNKCNRNIINQSKYVTTTLSTNVDRDLLLYDLYPQLLLLVYCKKPEPFLAVTYTQDATLPIRHYEEVKGWIYVGQKILFYFRKNLIKKMMIEMKDQQTTRTCRSDFFLVSKIWSC